MLPLRKADPSVNLRELLDSLDPKLYRRFIQMVTQIKDPVFLREIIKLISEGSIDQAMSRIDSHITSFADDTIQFYVQAGKLTAVGLAGLVNTNVNFSQVNDRAVRMMQSSRLRLISELTQSQRDAVRASLVQGITRGINPNQQAKLITQSIGLTASQIQAISNYRSLLEQNSSEALRRELRDRRFDPTIENSIDGLTESQINRMVDQYAKRQLDYRARMIARTESLRAVNQGSYEAFLQAIDSGDVDANRLNQEWLTAQDSRVRDSHITMHGQLRPFGQPFISGSGHALLYPGDPNAPASEVIHCRCVISTTLKRGESTHA